LDDRLSHPELEIQPKPNSDAPFNTNAISVTAPLSTTAPSIDTNSAPAITEAALATGDTGGNFGGGGQGGFRQRTFKGPGSASATVVGKLAPGIARPKVFHQALPEKPASPEEGAMALFTQALFGSAEFRYLQ
jgi:hypothetical protein